MSAKLFRNNRAPAATRRGHDIFFLYIQSRWLLPIELISSQKFASPVDKHQGLSECIPGRIVRRRLTMSDSLPGNGLLYPARPGSPGCDISMSSEALRD